MKNENSRPFRKKAHLRIGIIDADLLHFRFLADVKKIQRFLIVTTFLVEEI